MFMLLSRRAYRPLLGIVCAALGLVISLTLPGRGTQAAAPPSVQIAAPTAAQPEAQGRALYEIGQFSAAIPLWQQAAQVYQAQGDFLGQARVLSNLALAYQQLGQWPEATQAVADSLTLLQNQRTPDGLLIFAHVLNTQGGLLLAQGQAEQALAIWQQATTTYQHLGDTVGALRSQINQAQAMQALGLYRRALETLTETTTALESQPESPLKVVALRHLGDMLRLTGDLAQARAVLEQSLALATRLQLPAEQGAALLSLGTVARAQQDGAAALSFYEQAASLPTPPQTALLTQLAQLSLQIDQQQWAEAQALWPAIQAQLDRLPANHTTVYARINLVRSLVRLKQASAAAAPDWLTLAQILATAAEQAQSFGDQRAQAYALGHLGNVYEQTEQWQFAQALTEQALQMAQALDASDIAYQWQWQLGRLLKQQGETANAIKAYTLAVKTLNTLRGDLVAINAELQFSFRKDIEPIYRELVGLLLQPEADKTVPQAHLLQARDVIESLQLAELDNFFREACLDTEAIEIDQVDPQAAIVYTIILGDRLNVILRLPEQPLRHYSVAVAKTDLEAVTKQFRDTLVIRSRREFLAPAQQLYDWLIRPVAEDLQRSGVNTLVFVLDGPLLNIPMAALHDGHHYLIESYGVALTPGLKLLSPRAIPREQLSVLAAGLTEARPGFASLHYAAAELEAIEAAIPNDKVLLDQAFTRQALRQELQTDAFSIVHIATHGQFSSRAEDTFILAWDDRINVADLDETLQANALNQAGAIELLVLSACETAVGDQRAALGIAGVAVRAGARSTLATLWSINDQATTEFSHFFYQQLAQPTATRANALRQAQLSLLNDPQYRHPLYWAPYILVGNWL
jgi:CHAT domain-containing protein